MTPVWRQNGIPPRSGVTDQAHNRAGSAEASAGELRRAPVLHRASLTPQTASPPSPVRRTLCHRLPAHRTSPVRRLSSAAVPVATRPSPAGRMPPRKGSQAAGVLWWKQHKNDPDIEAIEARIAAEEEEHQNERTKQERMMNEWYNEQTPGTRQAYDYEQSRTQHERAGVALYTGAHLVRAPPCRWDSS